LASHGTRLRRSSDDDDRFSFKRLESVREFVRDENGVAALEYVLIISVALVLVVALVSGFGQTIIDLFSSVTSAI
jgi:Flp pilus assembly pilin Flp